MSAEPPRFNLKFIDQARKLSELGATDFDLCEFFSIDNRILRMWRQEQPEFADAIKLGAEPATDAVERALYARSVGYTYRAEKLFYNKDTGEVIHEPYIAHCPPETKAAIFWLINKRGADWKDSKIVERQLTNVTREQLYKQLTDLHARSAKRNDAGGIQPSLSIGSSDPAKH